MLNCIINFISETIWAYSCLCGNVFDTNSTDLINLELSKTFYFSLSQLYTVCYIFLKTCQFYLGCLIYWHKGVHSIPILSFFLSSVSLVILLLLPLILPFVIFINFFFIGLANCWLCLLFLVLISAYILIFSFLLFSQASICSTSVILM